MRDSFTRIIISVEMVSSSNNRMAQQHLQIKLLKPIKNTRNDIIAKENDKEILTWTNHRLRRSNKLKIFLRMSRHFRQTREILPAKKCNIIRILLQILLRRTFLTWAIIQIKQNQKRAARGLTREANILSLIKSLQRRLQRQPPPQQH